MKLLRDSEVRRDLDRRTQAKGETIFDFADCFRYLVRHLRRKPEETELVEMFLRNLRSEYRRHIVAARPWTIDEAVELGQELEQMLEDDERFEEPPPKSKMNLADAGVQTKKTVKIAAIEEVANSSVSDGPQKGNKTPAKKQTAKQQQKVPQSNKTKAEKATKTSKAKDSAEETPNSEPVTSYELSPNPWHYPAYDEWQAHAMSAMQYAPAVAMPTMPPWPTWPPRPMYQAPWPPAPPEQGRGQMAWNNLVRPPVQASANAGNDSPGIDRPKGKFSGPCFNCQTPGHHAANCPHKICTICKQNGHGQNACPNKPIAPPPNAGSQACTEKCQMCGQAGFTVLTCPQSAPIDSQETQSIEDSSAEDGERVVEVVYTEENELPEEDDWNESLNKIETEAIVGQVMHEAEEYSRNSLAKVISAKATRKAAETREESVERPPQAKWESCLRGLEDESQQLWLEIQPSPEITIGPDAQTPDQAEIAALYNDNRHFAKIALGGREYTALIDPGATCSMVLPRVAEEIGATVEKKAGWLQGGAGGISKTWGDLPMTLSVDGLDGRIRAKLCDTVRHDAVLGMDFIFEFDVDLRGGRHMWRAREGPWHPSKLPEAEDRPLLFAECAGISLCEPGEVERLNELINRLLPEDNPAPGLTNRSEHHIRVMTNTPVRHHLRRMSPAMEVVAQAEVKKLYEAGFIERSASDWCSAPVIVRKQDGSNRFCIDYRDLNKVTLQDQYPIPNMDGILDKLRKAKYLSKVDLKNAYHQISMEEHSKPYTAFAVPGSGLWQYTRMPFGLCNAPRTFQRLIDSLFGPEDQPHIFGYLVDIIVATDSFDEHLRWLEFRRMPYGLTNAPGTFQALMDRLIGPEWEPHVFSYLDDIIIVTNDFEEHLIWLKRVLSALKEANLQINREKSEFLCSEKSSNQARSGLMGQRHLEGPWSVVAADIIGPKPASKGGVRYVLVFVDLFTKYVELIGLRKANGKAVVKAMDELIINRWGCPRYLLTDNGTEFVNKDVGQYLASLGVEQTTIPPYIARCNPTERVNRNLRSMIASYIEEDQSDWDLHLQELKFALNTAHHDSIGTTPSFLNFGRGKRPREDLTERSRTRSVTFRFARRPGMSRSGEFPDGNGDSHPFRLFCRSSTRACYRGGRHICLTVRMRSPVYDDEAEEVQAREREEPGAALPGVAAVEPAVEDLAAPDVIAAEEVAGGLAEGGPSTERSSRSESPIAMEIEPPAAAEAEAAEMRELTLDLTSERRTSLDLPTVRLSAIVDQSNAQPSSGPSQDLRFICDSDSASENERYLRFRSERPSDERLSSERLRSAIRSRRARDSQ
uniref:Reverse transcriptase n=1 Tax=Trichogramma kaykai TaxID=54128 RepID=A0ABD2WQ37_9HYME